MSQLRPLCAETLRWCSAQLNTMRRGAVDIANEKGKPETAGYVDGILRKLNEVYAEEWNRIEGELRDRKRRLFYFGTWDRPGHFWFDERGRSIGLDSPTPFGCPDGTYQPDNGEAHHVAALRHKDGWTILAWWDRGVDKRGGCCGALAWQGAATFEAMVELLKRFPLIHDRVVPLTKWEGKTRSEARSR